MKVLNVLVFLLFSSSISILQAQSEKKSYAFKKGQVIDVLLLNNNPDAEEKRQEYFKIVFPIASEMGYNPLPGLSISAPPTQGNYAPDFLALAFWENTETQEKAMARIEKEISDFHQRRREIWPTFFLTHYEAKEDISFEIDPNKFYIVTTYWEKNKKGFQRFKKEWIQKTANKGGKVVLELNEGDSPFGYYYNPDFMAITEWNDKAAFDAFYKENLQMDHSAVQHVNQFNIK